MKGFPIGETNKRFLCIPDFLTKLLLGNFYFHLHFKVNCENWICKTVVRIQICALCLIWKLDPIPDGYWGIIFRLKKQWVPLEQKYESYWRNLLIRWNPGRSYCSRRRTINTMKFCFTYKILIPFNIHGETVNQNFRYINRCI